MVRLHQRIVDSATRRRDVLRRAGAGRRPGWSLRGTGWSSRSRASRSLLRCSRRGWLSANRPGSEALSYLGVKLSREFELLGDLRGSTSMRKAGSQLVDVRHDVHR